jgi:hypothetical protein
MMSLAPVGSDRDCSSTLRMRWSKDCNAILQVQEARSRCASTQWSNLAWRHKIEKMLMVRHNYSKNYCLSLLSKFFSTASWTRPFFVLLFANYRAWYPRTFRVEFDCILKNTNCLAKFYLAVAFLHDLVSCLEVKRSNPDAQTVTLSAGSSKQTSRKRPTPAAYGKAIGQ